MEDVGSDIFEFRNLFLIFENEFFLYLLVVSDLDYFVSLRSNLLDVDDIIEMNYFKNVVYDLNFNSSSVVSVNKIG